jgi:hypothetical protein
MPEAVQISANRYSAHTDLPILIRQELSNLPSGRDMDLKKNALVGLGVLALAAPAAALAEKGGNGKGGGKGGKGQTKLANYQVKGTWAGDGVVSVDKTNGWARKAGWKNTDVTFDFTNADIRVEDKNLDGVEDLGDFTIGDRVRVKAKLPRQLPEQDSYEAKRLDDRSTDDVEEPADD